MKRSQGWIFLTGIVLAVGCNNPQRRPFGQTPPPPPAPGRPVVAVNPAPVTPPPPPGMEPMPANVTPGMVNPPPGATVNPFPVIPPPNPPNTSGTGLPQSDAIARVENRWVPSDNGVHLGTPVPVAGAEGKSAPRLYPPDKTAEPPLNNTATALPVGIPQFAMAMDNVAAGLRPALDDGLDWLKARGYRTVVCVHLPDEKDEPDRKQVEKRGLKYVSFEISPQTLTKEKVKEFSDLVKAIPNQPLFLYDRDGSLAGGLWYLHFRFSEQCPDDAARVRAESLGMRLDRDGTHRDMWLAVQKVLNDKSDKSNDDKSNDE